MPSTWIPEPTVGGHDISHFTRIGVFPPRSKAFQMYSERDREVSMPQRVRSSGWPTWRMLKSRIPWVPGHEPVDRAVQPGGVSVGKTPTMGRHTPASISARTLGMWPASAMFFTSSMLAPSIPATMARLAGAVLMGSLLMYE